MITFREYLEEASKYPDYSPTTQKSEADVKSALGTGKFNSMAKHKWLDEYRSYDMAYKHGVSRAGFHEVEVYPYMKDVHTTPEGAVRPTTMLQFHFSPTKVTQVHKFVRGKEKDATWKHSKSWKKDESALTEMQRTIQGTLNIFDIDDTLFHTNAMIVVKKNGVTVKELTNQEFNNYTLKPGEEFDFEQFRDAKKFREESKPIDNMIEKAKIIVDRQRSPLSKTIIITARADFHDKNQFLEKFRDHGFPIDKVYVERAGNMPGDEVPAIKKAIIVRDYLNTSNYIKTRMFDDSMTNLKAFLSLQKEYPHVKFEAYFVKSDGSIRVVK